MTRVAVVQMNLFRSESFIEFQNKLDAIVAQAARQSAQLVALPAHIGLCLFQTDLTDLRVNPAELTRATRGGLRQAYESHCGALAAKYKLYLAAGTSYIAVNDSVYHVAYLFGPDGKLAAAQAQTHRSPRDRAWELGMADALTVYDTPLGRIGFIVGADLNYPEVARILCLQGAQILIHPGERPLLGPEEQLASLWRDTQANQVYGLEPCIIGRLAAQDLRGPSAIMAPCELTPDQSGVLALCATPTDPEIIYADIDLDALHELHQQHDVFQRLNPPLYAAHLVPAMQAYRGESA